MASVRATLEEWMQSRHPTDYSLFASILTSPPLLTELLRDAPSHAKLTPTARGGGLDVKPLQEQSDNVWHSLLWKWLLVPR